MDRKEYLLGVCLELLQKQNDSSYVLDILSQTINYDEADCDGHCLMSDIKIELSQTGHTEHYLYDVQCADSGSQWMVKAKSKEQAKLLIIAMKEYQYDNESEFMVDKAMDLSDKAEVYCNDF